MPLLRKGVLLPIKGVDFSQPTTFLDDRNGFPTNMRYYKSELRKRPGKSIVGNIIADASPIMGLGKVELSTGSKHLFRASRVKLERLNTTTNLWESIANTPFTGTDLDFFFSVNVTESEMAVITNGYDRIRKWIGSGNNALLGGNPPLAKYCAYLSPYLMIAHTNDGGSIKPWEVRWADTDNPENWTTGNSGSALLSDEPSPIQNIVKLNEFVAVYKKDSIWLGRKVETSDIFVFQNIKTGIGLASSRAVADADGKHFFMGLNDFYVWNGIREESIGGPVREEVFERVDRKNIHKCFALHVQELTEIWFFIKIVGHDWPTEVWKYNYRTGFWFVDSCVNISTALRWEKTKTESWDDDPGMWDAAQDIWDAATSFEDWEEIILGQADGYTSKIDYTTTNDNGAAVDSNFVTKDFIADTLEISKRWLQLDFWGRGPGRMFIDYSIDFGSNWINIPFSAATAYVSLSNVYQKYEFYFDVWSPQIRFRFRNNRTDETFYVRNFYPYYLHREEIKT